MPHSGLALGTQARYPPALACFVSMYSESYLQHYKVIKDLANAAMYEYEVPYLTLEAPHFNGCS